MNTSQLGWRRLWSPAGARRRTLAWRSAARCLPTTSQKLPGCSCLAAGPRRSCRAVSCERPRFPTYCVLSCGSVNLSGAACQAPGVLERGVLEQHKREDAQRACKHGRSAHWLLCGAGSACPSPHFVSGDKASSRPEQRSFRRPKEGPLLHARHGAHLCGLLPGLLAR